MAHEVPFPDSQDKAKSIADSMPGAESLITVVKIGAVGREFNVYKRSEGPGLEEDTLIWSEVIKPGDAIIMTLDANLKTKHEVPVSEESGDSGSIVFRSICDIVPYAEVQKKIVASRKQKESMQVKKEANKAAKAAAPAAAPASGKRHATEEEPAVLPALRQPAKKQKLPNRGEPPDYVVGEKVFYTNACEHVCVKRVWIDKAAMDKDVQPVFRDASQIAVEYLQAASSDGNRDKINVEHYNHNAWYEVIWTAHDKFRQIVPQSYLSSNRDPWRPRPMVTEEQSFGLPKPSEWHEFAADYDSDDEE